MLDENIYAGNADVYNGSWRFKKHYWGTYAIPKFDGKKPFGEGEEFECAKLIDSSAKVLYWLRNKDSDSASFCLPMGAGQSGSILTLSENLLTVDFLFWNTRENLQGSLPIRSKRRPSGNSGPRKTVPDMFMPRYTVPRPVA